MSEQSTVEIPSIVRSRRREAVEDRNSQSNGSKAILEQSLIIERSRLDTEKQYIRTEKKKIITHIQFNNIFEESNTEYKKKFADLEEREKQYIKDRKAWSRADYYLRRPRFAPVYYCIKKATKAIGSIICGILYVPIYICCMTCTD